MIELDALHRDRHTEEITGVTFKITGEDTSRDSDELRAECLNRIQKFREGGLDIPELPEYTGWIQPNYLEGGIEYQLSSFTIEGF